MDIQVCNPLILPIKWISTADDLMDSTKIMLYRDLLEYQNLEDKSDLPCSEEWRNNFWIHSNQSYGDY